MEFLTVKELKDAGLTFIRGDYHGAGRSLFAEGANNNQLADYQVVTKLAWRECAQENPEFTGEVELERVNGKTMWRPKLHSIINKGGEPEPKKAPQ